MRCAEVCGPAGLATVNAMAAAMVSSTTNMSQRMNGGSRRPLR
jgi:hypothetical protein